MWFALITYLLFIIIISSVIPYTVTYKIKYTEIPNRIRRNRSGTIAEQLWINALMHRMILKHFEIRIFVNFFMYLYLIIEHILKFFELDYYQT